MSKVWVVNFAGHDYRKAEEYGELVPVTVGYVGMGSLDRTLFDVVNGLKESGPEDWLLLSGLIALNAIAAAVWLRMHGKLRLLIYDRKFDVYREMRATSGHIDYLVDSLKAANGEQLEEEICPEGSANPD